MLHIKIPKPCHQNWDEMTPTSKGAFCSACAKEVVDFTAMTDAEVQMYFQFATGKVCGKFKSRQLRKIRIYPHLFYGRITGWKKFMAMVLLVFGSMLFGCDVTMDFKNNQEPKVMPPADDDFEDDDGGNTGMVSYPSSLYEGLENLDLKWIDMK